MTFIVAMAFFMAGWLARMSFKLPKEEPRPVLRPFGEIYYSIGSQNGQPFIQCGKCGRRSFNRNDIAHRYCHACSLFFADEILKAAHEA